MQNKWLVMANATHCYVYEYDISKNEVELNLIQELYHPDSRLKGSDIELDKSGHYQAPNHAHGSYDSYDPKGREKDTFAREIINFLDKSNNDKRYSSLILVSAPHFAGIINSHLKNYNINIDKIIHKDYINQFSNKNELNELVKSLILA